MGCVSSESTDDKKKPEKNTLRELPKNSAESSRETKTINVSTFCNYFV